MNQSITAVVCRFGYLPYFERFEYAYSDSAENVSKQRQLLESVVGPGYQELPYPSRFDRSDLALWRGSLGLVVAARLPNGTMQSVDEARLDPIGDDILKYREEFLPYFLLSNSEFANWIDNKGEGQWWSVDGDPLLTGRVNFPCPGDELLAAVRKVNKNVLVFDKQLRHDTTGQPISWGQVDDLVIEDDVGSRVLQLCWKDAASADWLLLEDEDDESSESSGSSMSVTYR